MSPGLLYTTRVPADDVNQDVIIRPDDDADWMTPDGLRYTFRPVTN